MIAFSDPNPFKVNLTKLYTRSNVKNESENPERSILLTIERSPMSLLRTESWENAWDFPVWRHWDSKTDTGMILQAITSFRRDCTRICRYNCVVIDWTMLFKVFTRNIDLSADKLVSKSYSSGRKFTRVGRVGHRNSAPLPY